MVNASAPPIESGEETVEMKDKPIAARWQSRSYRYNASFREEHCSLIVKVWTRHAVPTWLVRKTEDKTCPAVQDRPALHYVSDIWMRPHFNQALTHNSGAALAVVGA